MQLKTHSRSLTPLASSLISAGSAVEISEDYDLLDVNELITKGREGFVAFEVTGESMVDHIQPGNIVFVDTWAEARSGNIVATVVNGLTNIKIFKASRKGLYLVPANSEYTTQEINQQDSFHILGVVKGHLAVYPQ